MTEIRAGSPKVPRRRLAIYSQDSLGLGHLRRTTLIGGAFLGADTDSNVLLFADSPVAPFFELPNGMDVVKLPSIRKVSAGCWEATRLRVDDRELIRFRADLLRSGLLNFRPDVLLVDHMPGGAQRELIPALEALKRKKNLRVIVAAPPSNRRSTASSEFPWRLCVTRYHDSASS